MKQLHGILLPLLAVILKNYEDRSNLIHPQSSIIERNGWCQSVVHLVDDAVFLWRRPAPLPLLKNSTLHMMEPTLAETPNDFKEKRIVHGPHRLILRYFRKNPRKQIGIYDGKNAYPGYCSYTSPINPLYGGLCADDYLNDPLKFDFLPPHYRYPSLDFYGTYPLQYFFKSSYYSLPRICRSKTYKLYKLRCVIRKKKGHRRFCARYRNIVRIRC